MFEFLFTIKGTGPIYLLKNGMSVNHVPNSGALNDLKSVFRQKANFDKREQKEMYMQVFNNREDCVRFLSALGIDFSKVEVK
jgi:hypothetical protein